MDFDININITYPIIAIAIVIIDNIDFDLLSTTENIRTNDINITNTIITRAAIFTYDCFFIASFVFVFDELLVFNLSLRLRIDSFIFLSLLALLITSLLYTSSFKSVVLSKDDKVLKLMKTDKTYSLIKSTILFFISSLLPSFNIDKYNE